MREWRRKLLATVLGLRFGVWRMEKKMGTYLRDMGLSYRVIYGNGEESGVSIGFIVSLQASSFTAQCLGFGMAWAIDCRP